MDSDRYFSFTVSALRWREFCTGVPHALSILKKGSIQSEIDSRRWVRYEKTLIPKPTDFGSRRSFSGESVSKVGFESRIP